MHSTRKLFTAPFDDKSDQPLTKACCGMPADLAEAAQAEGAWREVFVGGRSRALAELSR